MTIADIDHGSGSETAATTIGKVHGPDRTHSVADLIDIADQAGWHRNVSRTLIEDGTRLHETFGQMQDDALMRALRAKTGQKKRVALTDLLAELGTRGFAWRDLARIFGVSVPALRKWRQGESAIPENRMRVAEFVALCELIEDRNPGIPNAAPWLEMPLVPNVEVTGLDLAADQRIDLVLRYAHDNDAERILDIYRPNWRDETDSEIIVVIGPDGMPGIGFAQDR